MERRRVPLPTARVALPHVGRTREPRPGRHACTDKEVGRLLRCSQPEHRPLGHLVPPSLQRRNVRSLRAPTAAASAAWQAHGRRSGQRGVPPRTSAQATAPQASSPLEPVLSAAVQPAALDDRASVEAHQAARYTQPLLPDPASRPRRSNRLLPPLAAAERDVAQAMLHHLSRCV